ncbi:TlpA family protein disulfide reductase [Methylobacter sp.]|uniref:TlpA family protein disulfide reductase n=1 Tax=Methylobacter sp. TaxID=2051955 RepID=UPI002FDE50D3
MRIIAYLQPLLLGLLVVAALGGCNKRTGLQTGDAAPSATLTDFRGKSVTLPDAIKGKVALVRFWSMDCGFCDKQIVLSLETLYQKYKDRGFVPVAIDESRIVKTDERLKQFDHLTYPMLVDEYGLVAKRFGVIGLPTTFVIDEQGIVRDKITGEAGIDEYEKRFTTILYKGVFYENGQ